MAKKKGSTAKGSKPAKAKSEDGLLGRLTRVVAVLFAASLLLEQVVVVS